MCISPFRMDIKMNDKDIVDIQHKIDEKLQLYKNKIARLLTSTQQLKDTIDDMVVDTLDRDEIKHVCSVASSLQRQYEYLDEDFEWLFDDLTELDRLKAHHEFLRKMMGE